MPLIFATARQEVTTGRKEAKQQGGKGESASPYLMLAGGKRERVNPGQRGAGTPNLTNGTPELFPAQPQRTGSPSKKKKNWLACSRNMTQSPCRLPPRHISGEGWTTTTMLGGDDGNFSTAETLSGGDRKRPTGWTQGKRVFWGQANPHPQNFLFSAGTLPGSLEEIGASELNPIVKWGGGILPAEPKRGSVREKRASEEPKEAWGFWGRRANPLPKFSALKGGGIPTSPKLREGGSSNRVGVS